MGHTGAVRPADVDMTPPEITKVKSFDISRMTAEEAAENLDMVDHDFYVFVNSETNEVEIVYRRKDGKIGLLQPHAEEE